MVFTFCTSPFLRITFSYARISQRLKQQQQPLFSYTFSTEIPIAIAVALPLVYG